MRCLFIGGPLDGKARTFHKAMTTITVPSIEPVTYRQMLIGGVTLWAPEHWTAKMVMRVLLGRYEQVERTMLRSAA